MPPRARCVWSNSELARQGCSERRDRGGKWAVVNVTQDHMVLNVPRLANMAWTFDLADHTVLKHA